MSNNDELVKRIAALEAELTELKAELPPPKTEFKPNAELSEKLRNYDPTASMRMPGSAVKPMADLIHGKGPKLDRQGVMDAWKRNSPPFERGGFGAPSGPVREVDRGSGFVKAAPLDPPKGRWSK